MKVEQSGRLTGSVCSDADAVPICHGEQRPEPWHKAVHLPLNLHSIPHLRSRVASSVWKNEIMKTSSQNVLLPKSCLTAVKVELLLFFNERILLSWLRHLDGMTVSQCMCFGHVAPGGELRADPGLTGVRYFSAWTSQRELLSVNFSVWTSQRHSLSVGGVVWGEGTVATVAQLGKGSKK